MPQMLKNLPKYGDVVGVDRGMYSHYAVYIGDNQVIHYASSGRDLGKKITIHIASFREFLGKDNEYFICDFNPFRTEPEKIRTLVEKMQLNVKQEVVVNASEINLEKILDQKIDLEEMFDSISSIYEAFENSKYTLYSPEETVKRAYSRLGEEEYNLVDNNCEHFAIWCKTGIAESYQVKAVLRFIAKISLRIAF